MREIKFRAWDTENNVMIIISDVDFEAGCSYFTDERYIIMQYTGLHDKNGKEIYEGDIIHLTAIDKHFMDTCYKVVCEDYFFGLSFVGNFVDGKCIPTSEWYGKICMETPSSFRCVFRGRVGRKYGIDCEIIGNIYENEDLLSSEK